MSGPEDFFRLLISVLGSNYEAVCSWANVSPLLSSLYCLRQQGAYQFVKCTHLTIYEQW
jgi:hypothetical protein